MSDRDDMSGIRDLTERDVTLAGRAMVIAGGFCLSIGAGVGAWLWLRPLSAAAGVVGVLVGIGLFFVVYGLAMTITLLAKLIDKR